MPPLPHCACASAPSRYRLVAGLGTCATSGVCRFERAFTHVSPTCWHALLCSLRSRFISPRALTRPHPPHNRQWLGLPFAAGGRPCSVCPAPWPVGCAAPRLRRSGLSDCRAELVPLGRPLPRCTYRQGPRGCTSSFPSLLRYARIGKRWPPPGAAACRLQPAACLAAPVPGRLVRPMLGLTLGRWRALALGEMVRLPGAARRPQPLRLPQRMETLVLLLPQFEQRTCKSRVRYERPLLCKSASRSSGVNIGSRWHEKHCASSPRA